MQADQDTVAFGYSVPCQTEIIQRRGVNSLAQNVLPFPFCFTLITMNTTKKLVVLSTTLAAVLSLACNAFAAAPAETLSSGVKIVHSVDGTGAHPKATDTVKVHYRGTLLDGKEFDSSIKNGQPASFGVTQVIKGWTEALQLMKKGAKYQLFIPANLAYGERAMGPDIGPSSTLIFDVDLVDVKPPPTPAPAAQGSSPKAPPAPSPAPTKK